MNLAPGAQVAGRYTIVEELARGGMGAVYVATDEKFQSRVALKVAAGMGGTYDAFKARFAREARISHQLGRTHGVVRGLDWGELDDGFRLYLSMDLVEHATPLDLRTGSLEKRLRRLLRASQIVAGIHAQGVIHRDLKPANFLQNRHGAIFLTDFGLAKVTDEVEPAGREVTLTQVAMGTPKFMAPEQFEDAKRVDARADVHALGVMLYMAITGRYPYGGEAASVLRSQLDRIHTDQTPPSPREIVPELVEPLEALCGQAMALDPEERMPEAGQFASALGRILDTGTLTLANLEEDTHPAGALATPPKPGSSDDNPRSDSGSGSGGASSDFGIQLEAPSDPAPVRLQDPNSERYSDPLLIDFGLPRSRSASRSPAPSPEPKSSDLPTEDEPMVPPTPRAAPVGRMIAERAQAERAGSARSAGLVDAADAGLSDDPWRDAHDEPVPPARSRWAGWVVVLITVAIGTALVRDVGKVRSKELPRAVRWAKGQWAQWRGGGEPGEGSSLLSVDLDSPTYVGTGRLRISGQVTHPEGTAGTRVFLGDQPLAEVDAQGRFDATVELREGSHTLQVVAVRGEERTRTPWEVTVDRSPPRLRIIEPVPGAVVHTDAVTLRGRVEDGAPWVDVQIGANRVHVVGGEFSLNLALATGTNTITLRAEDAVGNMAPEQTLRVFRAPAWFGELPEAQRPSLPPGLLVRNEPGEYLHEASGLILVWAPRPGVFAGKSEVTVGQYQRYLNATGRGGASAHAAQTHHPARGLDLGEVEGYLRWSGLRLPSEAEWVEIAGGEARGYPWGDDWRSPAVANAQGGNDGFDSTAPVGTYARGASPAGCLDMAGNVAEWAVVGDPVRPWPSPVGPPGSSVVACGGSWRDRAGACRIADRVPTGTGPNPSVGFRVVLDPR